MRWSGLATPRQPARLSDALHRPDHDHARHGGARGLARSGCPPRHGRRHCGKRVPPLQALWSRPGHSPREWPFLPPPPAPSVTGAGESVLGLRMPFPLPGGRDSQAPQNMKRRGKTKKIKKSKKNTCKLHVNSVRASRSWTIFCRRGRAENFTFAGSFFPYATLYNAYFRQLFALFLYCQNA